MPTITERYLGDLRVQCQHVASGQTIITDAPKDNHGKGEAFSPTDLCSAALGACAMTIMGIEARELGLDIAGSTVDITKIMAKEPRRIARIEVIFNMEGDIDAKQRDLLEGAGRNCPLCLTLGPGTEIVFTFNWPK